MRSRRWAILVLIVLLVGACGGAGDTTDADGTGAAASPEATSEPPAPEPAVVPATSEPVGIVCEETTVATGDTTVDGERCVPAQPDALARPAVLVLNGCGGYESDDEVAGAIVRALAERGVIALRIDYLAAAPAPSDSYCEAAGVLGALQPILQAIVDGGAALRADSMVDADQVGVAGYSLGALAAMGAHLGGAGLTTVEALDLQAAALLSYPDQLPVVLDSARAGEVPPLFLMTGEADTTAPPAGAVSLAEAATEGGVPNDLVLVPGQGHPWRGEAAIMAAEAIAHYLAERLGA